MEFIVKKGEFLKNLQVVQNAISTKTNLPILANILIEADKDNIKLSATDLDIGISTTMQVKPKIQGSITLPGKKLLDIVRELPDEDITIAAKKNNIATIECGNVVFKIIGLPKEEFPQIPQFKDKDTIELEQKLLGEMIAMTGFAVSHDETRYVLNGVLMALKNEAIKLVATDGRRLAVVERKIPQKMSLEKKMIIPGRTVQELAKLLNTEGTTKVYFGENQLMIDLGQAKIISRLIEGEFPNYEQVIPKESKEKILLKREVFLQAAKRASLFTNQDSIAVKMDISKNKMTISKNTPYIGEIKETVDIDYKGKELSIGFNPIYIMDVLKNMDTDDVGFEITEPDKPGVMRMGNDYVYVVLPMQLV